VYSDERVENGNWGLLNTDRAFVDIKKKTQAMREKRGKGKGKGFLHPGRIRKKTKGWLDGEEKARKWAPSCKKAQ